MKLSTCARLKNVLFALSGLLLAAPGAFAQAPILPQTADYAADGGRGNREVVHTGTDAMILKDKRFQVMTWDRSQGDVMLSWSFENGAATGSQAVAASGFRLSDPDVVVAQYYNDVYAGLVYIKTPVGSVVGQAFYLPLTWNGSGFTPGREVALGASVNPVGTPRRHASPNVDATSDGRIALIWQETVVETANITITSPSYPSPGFSYSQDVTFGESYATAGYINGNILGCLGTRGKLASGQPRLLEQSLTPDVALSDGGSSIVSFTYTRYYFDPVSYSLQSSLVVRQVNYDCFAPLNAKNSVMEWKVGVSEPRIAATANSDRNRDVEVVGSRIDGGCDVPYTYQVLNYGYSDGDFRPGPTVVTPFDDLPASQPVVAYQAELGKEGVYVVAWTGYNYPKGNENDVWARTLIGGQLFQGQVDYSRVNMQGDGPQQVPSVAGRFLKGKDAAYLFYDQAIPQLSYKISDGLAGASGAPLRPAAAGPDAGRATDASSFQSYPNPFSTGAVFLLRPQADEVAREIVVSDMLGRTVDRIALQGAGVQEVKWEGPKNLPAGTYSARLVTSKRTETLRLTKN